MDKNVIIRFGKSKLSNGEIKSNLGDLIRTSCLLNCIEGETIWISDPESSRLLKYFVEEDKIIVAMDKIPPKFQESDVNIYCAGDYDIGNGMYEGLKGNWNGFIYDKENKILVPKNEEITYTKAYHKTDKRKSWQQYLVEGMEFNWTGQDYGQMKDIQNNEVNLFEIGLNFHTSIDWKTKQWSLNNWKILFEELSKEGYRVSWQKGLNNLEEYINWLNSSRIVVTNESLGMHLASALRKKVVSLVGPVDSNEYSYGRVNFLYPKDKICMPCNLKKCKFGENGCLDEIKIEHVIKSIKDNILS